MSPENVFNKDVLVQINSKKIMMIKKNKVEMHFKEVFFFFFVINVVTMISVFHYIVLWQSMLSEISRWRRKEEQTVPSS